MAKTYQEAYPETIALFEKAILNANLTQINIHICVDNSLKEIHKVSKLNDYSKHLTNYDVTVFLNEDVFEQLTEEQQELAIDDALAPIGYDMERGKMVISKPDVSTFSGILAKHGFDAYDVLRETIKSIYQKKKEDEDAEKATTEKAKKSRAY